MKHTKKLAQRIAAGAMSAALLLTGTNAGYANKTVKAADNDYYQALALSLYFYDANACGSGVGQGPLTWRGDCHVEDEKALLSNATGFDSAYTSLVDPDGDGKVDVGGGYHDAGDHIKFNLTMGFGFSSLAMSEYLNPGIYDKAGCKDHLIAICKRNADYLMKTTFLDGSGKVATICYVVADGGVDHSMMTPPEEQHYDRATYWLTASHNNSAVCGEMASALAGCAYLVKDSDPSYAKECLKYAKALYDFGTSSKGNEMAGQSPYYSTDEDSQDELLLASAWLYINGEGSQPSTKPSNGQYNGKYDCYRYTWDKVYQGYAALMYKATKDSAFKQELEYEVSNANGVNAGSYNGDGWGAARYNCGLQMSALAAADGNSSSPLATGSKWQMDYILGDNPLGYSFLIGYGSKWPTHIHHRAANPGDLSNNPEAKYTLYGCLVGGIDASGNYEDHSDKYQYTEGALDYNGCFALACAGLANLFGGSDKGASKIVSSASEIKYPYTFGSGSTVTPTPTETEAPEPTTESTQSTEYQQPTETTNYQQPTETTNYQQQTDPVETTTQYVQPSQPTEQDANVTELKDEKDATYWQIDASGASKVIVTFNSNSGDTEANGVFNPPGGWTPEDWSANISNGTFTLTYENTSNNAYIDVHVWWPQTATLVSAVKVTNQAAATTQQTQQTTQQTTTTTTTTQAPQPSEQTTTQPTQPTQPNTGNTNVNYGDVNQDGNVDIMDVIILNKYLLGNANLGDTSRANADVNADNNVDQTDSLNILKCVVELISKSDFPIR